MPFGPSRSPSATMRGLRLRLDQPDARLLEVEVVDRALARNHDLGRIAAGGEHVRLAVRPVGDDPAARPVDGV